MKISKLTIITSILVISIPVTYYSARAFDNNTKGNELTISDIAREIKLLKSEISTLKQANTELIDLKMEVAQLKEKRGDNSVQAQIQNGGQKNTDDNRVETETTQITPVEIEKKQADQRAKELDLVNNAFLAETSDPQWAPEATTLVSSFFESDAGAKIKLSDLECRKTLCKVEISKPDSAEANDNLMLNFPMHVSKALSQSSSYYTQNEDGTTRVTMYLVRNGYELPTNF